MHQESDPVRVSLYRQKMWRLKKIPVRFVLPNVITLLALCSGITAVRLGIEGNFEWAVGALILAALFDATDGRIARLMKGTSRFGAELDSLADFVNFGVAPAILVYIWSLSSLKNLGWIVALGFAMCCALRLARFNVAIDDPEKPPFASNFFVGVPAPAGGCLALAPIYMSFLGWMPEGKVGAYCTLFWLGIVSAGMISRIPIWSGKLIGQKIDKENVLPLIVLTVLAFVVFLSYPWEALVLSCTIYLGSIPFSLSSYERQRRQWDQQKETLPQGELPQ